MAATQKGRVCVRQVRIHQKKTARRENDVVVSPGHGAEYRPATPLLWWYRYFVGVGDRKNRLASEKVAEVLGGRERMSTLHFGEAWPEMTVIPSAGCRSVPVVERMPRGHRGFLCGGPAPGVGSFG